MKKTLIHRLNKVMINNYIVIEAINDNKKINIEKAIKAIMKSNNEIASIVKEYITNHNLMDKIDTDYLNKILKEK